MGSRSKEIEVATASKTSDIRLPMLELDIQNARNTSGPNLNLVELQRDITILTTKYELLQ
jgi:hypothetical protein